MELLLSITAIVIAVFSVIVSVVIYYQGTQREKKQATLDAFNILQEQAFDRLNQYTFKEIKEICDIWQQTVISKNNKAALDGEKASQEENEKREHYLAEYRTLSGYLARIEHFALGVNTGIYDVKVAERAGTSYLVMQYRGKLKPMIEAKHSFVGSTEYYAEFRKLVEQIEKIKQ